MFEKPKRKKKKKQHKESIMHTRDGTCYLCMKLEHNYRIYPFVHEHHIFEGSNRQISEAEGMKVYLCLEHHTVGPKAVHNNHEMLRVIQEDAQRLYEQTHTRQQFMELFGRNYLNDREKEAREVAAQIDRNIMRLTVAGLPWMLPGGLGNTSSMRMPVPIYKPSGFIPLEDKCNGCFGAANDDCERRRKEGLDGKG